MVKPTLAFKSCASVLLALGSPDKTLYVVTVYKMCMLGWYRAVSVKAIGQVEMLAGLLSPTFCPS